MKKKYWVMVLVTLMAAAVAILALSFFGARPNAKTDEEIKQMFRCNRITLEILATDIYCGNPDLYRQDLRNNKVVEPNDYSRIR